MIKVLTKINKTKDENIKEAIKAMVSCTPVKIGEYWIYGKVPVEFEEIEK